MSQFNNSVPYWRCCKECDRRRAGGRVWGLSKWRREKIKRETRKEIKRDLYE